MNQPCSPSLSDLPEPEVVSDSEVERLIQESPGCLVNAWIVAASDEPNQPLFVAAGMDDQADCSRAHEAAIRLTEETGKQICVTRGVGKVVPSNIVRL